MNIMTREGACVFYGIAMIIIVTLVIALFVKCAYEHFTRNK